MMTHSLTFFLALSELVYHEIRASATPSSSLTEIETYIYADNFFDLFLNGEHVSSDTRLLPHTAFQSTLKLYPGDNILALYLRDNANNSTGLEYGDRCVGDAGFRFRALDDSIVSDSEWKCRTVFYGPINPEQCYGLGLDTTGYSAFGDDGLEKTLALVRSVNPITACRDTRDPVTSGQDGFSYESCQTVVFPWFDEETEFMPDGSVARADWMHLDYDDSHWDQAIVFPEVTVGWGATPGNATSGAGPAYFGEANDEAWGPEGRLDDELIGEFEEGEERPISAVIPSEIHWGESEFIWRPSLRFDNGIVCRTTVYVEPETETCSNGVIGVEGYGHCCPLACGICGGLGCKKRALDVGLTADDCCTRRIEESGASCDETRTAPCMMGSGD